MPPRLGCNGAGRGRRGALRTSALEAELRAVHVLNTSAARPRWRADINRRRAEGSTAGSRPGSCSLRERLASLPPLPTPRDSAAGRARRVAHMYAPPHRAEGAQGPRSHALFVRPPAFWRQDASTCASPARRPPLLRARVPRPAARRRTSPCSSPRPTTRAFASRRGPAPAAATARHRPSSSSSSPSFSSS
eukprot:scaffold2089_cov336-Prasinococcus_capsulatus_cf.AAC.6